MLRILLEDRFGVAAHFETKSGTIYSMVIRKGGLKAKSADGSAVPTVESGFDANHVEHIQSPAMSFNELANLLSVRIVAPIPVRNLTGLTALYQIHLAIPWMNIGSPPTTTGPALDPAQDPSITAAQIDSFNQALKDLGLELKPDKGPIRNLIVDHLERSPSTN